MAYFIDVNDDTQSIDLEARAASVIVVSLLREPEHVREIVVSTHGTLSEVLYLHRSESGKWRIVERPLRKDVFWLCLPHWIKDLPVVSKRSLQVMERAETCEHSE